MDTSGRMKELKGQGYFCSQILMQLALDLQGKDNPDLIRAMQGLAGGLGFAGEVCGALTGGACLLGLYAGKGRPEEDEDLRLMMMVPELVRWFKETYEPRYGGIRCEEILQDGRPQAQGQPCAELVASTFQKVKELLVENGLDLSGTL